MSQSIPNRQSQEQDNLIKDTNVSGDLIFAPVQIGTKIETQIVQISVAKVTQQPLIKNSPYQGLKRFNLKDRDRFFGRDTLIARLFEAVNRSNLSLVLGASGSGKSSVVRAGLIPELKKSLESQTFYDLIFTPNQDPFDSLYRCLLSEEKDYSFTKAEAEIVLEAKADTLTNVISRLRKDKERWLIFVDQFEELFTICDDPDKRKNFIAGLVEVAKSGNSSVKIILAMRSDFLEQFSFYSDLGAIANQNNIHLVTEMYPDELRQAIEQPAAKHGVVFEEGLVEQIIKEVEGQKGYLPLLQYTLNLLWENECKTLGTDNRPNIEDRILNKRSYASLEGVRGALQKRVNEIYSNLNQDQKISTKQIFLKLVNIVDTDSGSRAVNRRAYRDEFDGESVEHILNNFIEEKLLVSSSEYSSQEELEVSYSMHLKQSATVEIAHEILLSSWDILKHWLEQEKEAIVLKNWLAGEARRWQKIISEDNSRAKDELLKGSRLAQVVEFRNQDAFKNIGGLSKQEEEFINASVEQRDYLRKQEEERQQRELELIRERLEQEKIATYQATKARKAAQKTTKFAIFAALLAIIALFAGGIAWQQQQKTFRLIENLVLRTDEAKLDIIGDLPVFLDQAKDSMEKKDYERSIGYYRSVVILTNRLQRKNSDNKKQLSEEDKVTIAKTSQEATKNLLKLIQIYRLERIKTALKNKDFGKLKGNTNPQDLEERFTDGALRETYKAIMIDTAADLNQNGILHPQKETDRVPCDLLKEIEEQWLEATKNQCSWFGDERWDYYAARCQELGNRPLSVVLFDPPDYTNLKAVLESCQIQYPKNPKP